MVEVPLAVEAGIDGGCFSSVGGIFATRKC